MSAQGTQNKTQPGAQVSDKVGLLIVSMFFYCFCVIMTFGIITTIFRYSMAGVALSQGDMHSAAMFATDGRPYYGPSYGPSHRTYGYNQQRPLFALNV